ncbi:mechanosensitive ion channel family protein [Corynebacterium sp. 335C]
MEFASYMLTRAWTWIADKGLAIAALVILAVLLPRVRRFVIATFTRNLAEGEKEENKGRRALVGAIVYTVEVVLYFVIAFALLGKLGISLGAAVVPATVVSAAIGFGAQSVIGDIIGGIFIIIEKQYGIGDWVEFHSPSGTVQGDVVNLTLRATTIRTLNGEAVIVPNAEARMCVNYSSKWSRAVVEAPVPIVHGSSVAEIQDRTMRAAQEAIDAPGIREHILSELSMQPATALNAPTTIGMPWTVTMRLIVDCDPGDQWLIERKILSTIIDTFWEEYGESIPESLAEDAAEAGIASPGSPELTDAADASRDDASAGRGSAAAGAAAAGAAGAAAGAAGAAGATAVRGFAERGDRDDAPTEVLDAETIEMAEAERRRSDLPSAGAAIDLRDREEEDLRRAAAERGEDPDEVTDDSESTATRRQKARRVLSAGGRARPSTVILIVLLLVLGAVNLATYEPGEDSDGVAGWLAPSRLLSDDEPAGEEPADGAGQDPAGATDGTGSGENTREGATTGERGGTGSGEGTDSGSGADSGTSSGSGSGSGSGTGAGTGESGGTGSGESGSGSGTGESGGSGSGESGGAGTGGSGSGTGESGGSGSGGSGDSGASGAN